MNIQVSQGEITVNKIWTFLKLENVLILHLDAKAKYYDIGVEYDCDENNKVIVILEANESTRYYEDSEDVTKVEITLEESNNDWHCIVDTYEHSSRICLFTLNKSSEVCWQREIVEGE